MYCTEEVVWTIQRKSLGDLSGERTEADKKLFCLFFLYPKKWNIRKNTDINDKILNLAHRKGSKKDKVVGSKEVKENEQN